MLLDLLPPAWRGPVGSVFVAGFVLAFVGRKVGARMIERAHLAGVEPWRGWRVMVEIGPGLRAVGEVVAPHLPAAGRAIVHSLSGADSDPPPNGGAA